MLAYLELTPVCNNRCPGCSNSDFIADFAARRLKPGLRRPLSGAEWEQVLERIGPSIRLLYLTGGEATLHPEFGAIVAEIERRHIDFALFTNARWRDPAGLVDCLAGLTTFQGCLISVHGASAATHEAFSGVAGSFDETIANVRLAVAAGLPVTISTVITAQNASELPQIWELSQELGAREVVFNRYLIPSHREGQPVGDDVLGTMAPTRQALRAAVQVIEDLRWRSPDHFRVGYGPCIPQCFTPSSSQGCGAGETFFVVDPWGQVKPCTDAPLPYGNILTQPIEEIWEGAGMQGWRDMIPSGCSSCAALNVCRTGCRAMALTSGLNRDPLMTEPLAQMPRIKKRDPALIIPLT